MASLSKPQICSALVQLMYLCGAHVPEAAGLPHSQAGGYTECCTSVGTTSLCRWMGSLTPLLHCETLSLRLCLLETLGWFLQY